MARPDFALTWGSDNAPFTAIEASDYAAGWVFRTGAPPRRVNFDYYQNLADQRANWLGEQMLLAVGHEWQSDVTYDAYAITRSPVDGQLYRSLTAGNIGNEPSVSGAQWALGVADSADLLNAQIANIAVASTVNLTTGAPSTSNIVFTGSGTINNVTVNAGRVFIARFDGAVTLTNSASLITNSGANIVTAAGDSCIIRATADDVVEVLMFVRGAITQNKTSSGYRVLHDGTANPIIMQWSTVTTSAAGYATATFPIAFPNAFLGISLGQGGTSSTTVTSLVNHPAATTVSVPIASSSGNSYVASTVRYIVIGN